jgi:preprotein translocase subunit SecD
LSTLWTFLLLTLLLFKNTQIKAETSTSTEPNSQIKSAFICPLAGWEMWFEVNPLQEKGKLTPETINAVARIMQRRLNSLMLANSSTGKAAVVFMGKNQILLQFQPGITPEPAGTEPEKIGSVLSQRGYLEFRVQKSGTQEQLAMFYQQREYTLHQLAKLRGEAPVKLGEFIEDEKVLSSKLKENNQILNQIFVPTKLNSKYIKFAKITPPGLGGQNWYLVMNFDTKGTKIFTQLTKSLAGKNRSLGIFFDNELITAPIIDAEYARTGITTGQAVITGKWTIERLEEIVIQLRSGALPARVVNYSVNVAKNNRCLDNSK